jgi:hypothetical protein
MLLPVAILISEVWTCEGARRIRNAGFRQELRNFDSVGIATGYGLEDQGSGREFESGRVKNFYFFISSRPALGSTQPPIKWVPGVKRQGREADHSPPTSAEKKMWIYTSTPHTSSWLNA